ncbi:energy-coupling factor transport system ATP-binding protein/energy-coupling factor transport system ATP-binding protein [Paenibacillus catalpae]|uniref:Energy-coupling factor transport system ATP-binding protein/energy-coupling factor transport system ATP-binding protein n=1 Tax=Paenibacillus catalpae TaxID=1045775 RepID=A0A1I1UHF1_9BACL|nr:ATP-binding cassette domain-containing protein [Paenibacillus catalpae]SFD70189.1 energy-coupling factor transport system ATP-binding protein/energy-coupling factor transport system ATP-binding protein [Paenibacillus catalpae]
MFSEKYLAELTNVSVKPLTYGEQMKVQPYLLKDISISIAEGEWMNLIGRNGSGKSTLARLIAGFGAWHAEGKFYKDQSRFVTGQVPIVLQQPDASMVGSTPWEDVVMMLEQHGVEGMRIAGIAENALRQTGLHARMHQPVETLSGGQKQLTAIAGCLAVQSPMLILDEVTAMLDPEACIHVMDKVRELNNGGVTVIWITQKLEELAPGDRVVALEQGELRFDGEAEKLFERQVMSGLSPCEELGFTAPYVIQTAWELEALGVNLRPIPMTPEMLAKAVTPL